MYGLSSVDPASDWYSASVPAIIYAISYNIEPRYDGTRLYKEFLISVLNIDTVLYKHIFMYMVVKNLRIFAAALQQNVMRMWSFI